MCPSGKRSFENGGLAWEAVKKFKHQQKAVRYSKRIKKKVPIRAYKCEWCDNWHITSNNIY